LKEQWILQLGFEYLRMLLKIFILVKLASSLCLKSAPSPYSGYMTTLTDRRNTVIRSSSGANLLLYNYESVPEKTDLVNRNKLRYPINEKCSTKKNSPYCLIAYLLAYYMLSCWNAEECQVIEVGITNRCFQKRKRCWW
jgi:hypothetical protein